MFAPKTLHKCIRHDYMLFWGPQECLRGLLRGQSTWYGCDPPSWTNHWQFGPNQAPWGLPGTSRALQVPPRPPKDLLGPLWVLNGPRVGQNVIWSCLIHVWSVLGQKFSNWSRKQPGWVKMTPKMGKTAKNYKNEIKLCEFCPLCIFVLFPRSLFFCTVHIEYSRFIAIWNTENAHKLSFTRSENWIFAGKKGETKK